MAATHCILFVRDAAAQRDFYAALLARPPRLDVPGMCEFELPGGAVLGLMPEAGIRRLLSQDWPAPTDTPRSELYLLLDEDPAPWLARALAAGAELISPLQARNWGHQAAYLRDPEGHLLALAQALD
ncbi:catechol 2,3-dioxygenase-like lactoylglutathione lyase family enzyme [Inhella inkyongensis]|uniref:Catechol 2,3-dioxygenase-like lactoylglutathione lyase family enzyme n=1 Tax=Inhella inkyongensis TaxID=392593 RepID=A0A840S9F4_9BURK|nr:VOC family protein [Inhella inkyongensis]MBB5205151.1 catechol 2,3-dioxygenase-like lactoylglutathione lyase family enzyme [Inhella inkyongensis]